VIKKSIAYEDFDGEKHVEDFYFHLSKLSAYIETLKNAKESKEIYRLFKEVILKAVGVKSPDARHFLKTSPDTGRPYSEMFEASPACEELIFSFFENGESASEFIRGLFPAKALAEAEAEAAKKQGTQETGGELLAVSPEPIQPDETTTRSYTRDELLAMSQEEFDREFGTDPIKMSPEVLQVAFQRKGMQSS
jgi:hypothetical protein